jgi:hypothetical protein
MIPGRTLRTGVWLRIATKWAIAAFRPEMTAFRESRPLSRSGMPWVIQSQGIAFADGRLSRIDFAFGASCEIQRLYFAAGDTDVGFGPYSSKSTLAG